jgi:DNA (cytosine-5)-methyltransferase 1
MEPIPVIDIFAGPGGLGEGFSSYAAGSVFCLRLSIEKDPYAHRTLELRAFFRQFSGDAPSEFYSYLTGSLTRDELFRLYPRQAAAARSQTWHAELGSRKNPDIQVDNRINIALGKNLERWVLIGGPPCQAYSLIGRSRIRGISIAKYETDCRHYLYRQYLKILAVHRPPVFVMENVRGLLSAQVKDQRIVENILRDLKDPGRAVPKALRRKGTEYVLHCLTPPLEKRAGDLNPEDYIVKSEMYGIPQARHRVILLGIRADLQATPKTLEPHARIYTIDDTIADIPPVRSGLSKEPDTEIRWQAAVRSAADSQWLRQSGVDAEVRAAIRIAAQNARAGLSRGAEFVKGRPNPRIMKAWFNDPRLLGFCNHSTREHIRSDLHRYLFAAAYGQVKGHSPGLEDFPTQLLPKHANIKYAILARKFNDRFRAQVAGRPSTTITSHISKDGHYFIHYDPSQCRSLTVREAARLQTFPDNYFFEGPRTQQYRQVGNAVPPILAKQIADVVADIMYRAGI